VSIKGNNNLHDWEIQGDVLDGFAEFGTGFPIATGQTVKLGKIPAQMEGFIPVRSLLHPGRITSIENVVYHALRESTYPHILFRFDELVLKTLPESKDAPYFFDSRCELAVAGVTNQISMPIGVLPVGGKQLKITGSTSIKMTDWGIKPPEARASANSVIRTADEVKVSFEWFVGPKAAAVRTVEMKLDVVQVAKNSQPYVLKTMGGVVTITNPPSSNPVHISFARWESDSDRGNVAVYRLTNAESHTIMVWDARVQVRKGNFSTNLLGLQTVPDNYLKLNPTDPAPEHSGWETVQEDWPPNERRINYVPAASDEFWVKRPSKTPWRVCILYSKDWTDSGNTYSGNYEVISEEMQE
jgi:hypothetical protein